MNNLLSYCGLADARISASEKDLPVKVVEKKFELLVSKTIPHKSIHLKTYSWKIEPEQ